MPADNIILAVAGNQTMDGGAGIDTLSMVNAGAAGSFVDLQSGLAFSTATGIDTVSNFENVIGSEGADGLYGDGGDNTFFATEGADLIDGRGGNDTFDAAVATLALTVNLATETASGGFTATLINVENVVTGGGADNIIGSSASNRINAGDGADTITGGGGDDSIEGGAGLDTVTFAGARSAYAITWDGATATVTLGGDTVSITNAGRLQFSDKDVLLVDDSSAEFATIQSAVDAASADDEILVAAGTYVEQVVVDGIDNLLIKSTGAVTIEAPADVTQIVVSSSGRALNGVVTVIGSTGVMIADVTVNGAGAGNSVDGTNANFVGVVFRNASGGLTNVDVTGIRDAYPGGMTVDAVPFPVQSGNQRGVGVQVDNDSQLGFFMHGGSISDFQKNATVFNRANLDVSGVTVTGGGAQTINAQNGFQVLNSTGTLSLNTVTDIGYAGSAEAYSGAFLAYGNTNLHITDNTIVGSNGATTDAKVVGIFVFDAGTPNNGGSITGNIISFVDEGIDVSGGLTPTGILIANNTITDLDLTDQYAAGVYFAPAPSATAYDVEGSAGADYLQGGSGADTLDGLAGDDTIDGAGGDDELTGGAGDDVITGGAGSDTLTGGGDDDTYVADAGDTIVEAVDAGNDTVLTTGDFTLAAGVSVETLTLEGLATSTETFEAFSAGPITDGENGWKFVGGFKDQEVIVDPNNPLNKVFRMSSDPGVGDFSGPYSPALPLSAGEPGTTADADSHAISFDFRAVQLADMSRLEVDLGTEARTDRNNFLVIENLADGLRIAVNEPDATGAFLPSTPYTGNRELVSGIDASAGHTLSMVARYVDGTDNDLIDVYLDGNLIGTTTSFENYRNSIGGTPDYNAEANQTSSLFFRGGAGAVTDGAGGQNQGFLFDNITNTVFNSGNSLTGNEFAQTITGDAGDNVLGGMGGNDSLFGGLGADLLNGGEGDDAVNGGGGIDTADYGTIAYTDATITLNAGSVTITTAEQETDTLTGVEKLAFDGDTVLIVGAGGFATIQAAVDAASDGDTILIAAGIYTEDITVDKSLTILGPNDGVPGSEVRAADAVVQGIITIAADGITLDGFTIDGGGMLNSAIRGAGGNSTHDNISIGNMVLTGQTGQPILMGFGFGGGIGSQNWTIADNLVTNITGNAATGIALFNITGLTLTGNVIDHDIPGVTGRRGINLDGIIDGVVTGNSVLEGGPANTSWGIQISMSDREVSNLDVSGNTVTGTALGIFTTSQRGLTDVSITGNTVIATNGILLNTGSATPVVAGPQFNNVEISGNSITATTYAVFVRDLHGTHANGPISYDGLVVSDNSVVSGVIQMGRAETNGGLLLNVSGAVEVEGSDFADVVMIEGTGAVNFDAGAGNDSFIGSSGADSVSGGAGIDTLIGGGGNDTLTGGSDGDSLDGGTGNDLIMADANDTVEGGADTDLVVLADGTDLADVVVAAVNFSGVEVIRTGDLPGDRTFVVLDGMSIQAAIDAAADGDTILVAPGQYTTMASYGPSNTNSGNNPVGLLVNKSVTITGVDDFGQPITDVANVEATVTSLVQSNWGTNFFVTAPDVTITGLSFIATSPDGEVNKAFEIIEDNFTLAHSVVGSASGDIGATIYINDDTSLPYDENFVSDIQFSTIANNILKGDFVLANGAGFGHAVTDLRLENNQFVLNEGASLDYNWGVIITGYDDEVAWRVQSVGPLVATGNSFADDYTTDRLLYVRDDDAARLPSAAYLQAFLASNGITSYAYAVDPVGGMPSVVPYGTTNAFVLALTAGNGSSWANPGDTLIVQTDGSPATETIVTDDLSIDLRSDGLNFEMGTGVASLTLLGAEDGNVTANGEDNTITGNNGVNLIDGGAGNDTVDAGAGADVVTGGAGSDNLNGGAGDDSFVYADQTEFGITEVVTGGADTDTVVYADTDGGTLTLSAQVTGIEAVILSTEGALNAAAMNLDASAVLNGLTITGNGAANALIGTTLADTINSGGGNDTVTASGGSDAVDGGSGLDTVVLAGNRAAWTITWDGAEATASNGTDLVSITDAGRLQFDDKDVFLVDDASAEYATIQSAVDAASNGDEVLVADGSYAGATISGKTLAIVGAGSAVNVAGTFTADTYDMLATDELRFENLNIDATGQTYGITVRQSSADVGGVNGGKIVLDGVDIANARQNGLFYAHPANGSEPVNGNTVGSVEILNSTFTANGETYSGARGHGHVNLFGFNGNLTVEDSTFTTTAADLGAANFRTNNAPGSVSTNGAQVNADKAISVSGIRVGTPGEGGYVAAGALVLSGVEVSGFYDSDAVSFYQIQSFSGITIADVNVDATARWALINFDSVSGPIDLSTGFTGTNSFVGAEVAELQGLNTADLLVGTDGNDLLTGRAGTDSLYGGDGNDLFFVTSAAHVTATEVISGGAGTGDTVYYAASVTETLILTANVTGIESVLVNPGAVAMNVNASAVGNGLSITGNGAANTLIGTAFMDTLTGGGGADSLNGGSQSDVIFGGADNDTLVGAQGSDTLEGGAGADIVNGGGNADTASYAASGAGVSVDLDASTATGGDATGDTLSSIENLTGSVHADTLTGDDAANVITGNGGSDRLDGGLGNDTVVFSGDWEDYTISLSGSTYSLVNGADTVTAAGFETFVFNGVSVDVTGDPNVIVTATAPTITSIVEIGTDEDGNDQTLAVDENPANGTLIATVTASDPNLLLSGDLEFSLLNDGDDPYVGPFVIIKDGPTTAHIETLANAGPFGAIDFEQSAVQTFRVVVTDAQGNFLRQSVTVNVLNVNEAPTDIVFDDNIVDENAVAATVTTFTVADPDAGDTFTFGLSDNRFEVVAQGGGTYALALKAGQALDHETEGSVDVTVTATDAAGLEYQETLTITVADANDAPTAVLFGDATPSIDENVEGGIITSVTGVDPDDGDTLTITVNDGDFEVVLDSGQYVLKLKDGLSLDYETETSRDVILTVTDGDGLDFERSLTIGVNPVNEAPGGGGELATYNYSVQAGLRRAEVLPPAIVDPEGDALTYQLSTAPTAGNFYVGDTVVTVGMTLNQSQFDSLRYSAPESADTYSAVFTVSDNVNDVPLNVVIDVTAGTNDTLTGDSLANYLDGGAANDYLYGAAGNDTLHGGSGDDMLYGGAGADRMFGGAGIDRFFGATGEDAFFGGSETDIVIYRQSTTDLVISMIAPAENTGAAFGDSYSNIENIIGGLGNDTITGNTGRNSISGDTGNDVIDGHLGIDNLTGGLGNDTFVFSTALGGTNADVITDYEAGIDSIALLSSLVAAIGGTLDASEFRLGSSAGDANDFLIYSASKGFLLYDADGKGGIAQVVIAKLTPGTVLTLADFDLI